MPGNRPHSIDRREAIRRVGLLLGGSALVSEAALLAGCRPGRPPEAGVTAQALFSPAEIAFLDEVAEAILPETDTPGAKAAGVGPFMAVMVTDSYDERDQRVFREGLRRLDEACRERHGTGFLQASPAERLALLEALDREQKAYMDQRAEGAPAHYFRMMKELALVGYFTSEVGCTRAMRYVEAPGRFDPCVAHRPGETIWASHA